MTPIEPWVARVYRRLLQMAPSEFRDLAGNEAGDVFAAMWRARQGRRRVKLVAVAFTSLARVIATEWWEEAFGPRIVGAQGREPEGGEMGDWIRNARYALRSFRRAPAISTTVVLLTGLGVGSVVTVFTVADHLFLRALPYPDAERLVFVERGSYSYPVARGLTEWAPSATWAASSSEDARLLGEGEPLVIRQARVSPAFFQVLGGRATVGRLFASSDHVSDGVAVVSAEAWERIWGREPALVGRTIRLNGSPVTVVGILDEDFVPPVRVSGRTVDVWRPVDLTSDVAGSHDYYLFEITGRMAPGSSLTAVEREVDEYTRQLADEYPGRYRNTRGEPRRMPVVSLSEATVGDARRPIGLLLGGAAVLLLIACANVAHLMLARGLSRSREFAVRRSIGASGMALGRQLLTESLLLGLGGGAVGAGLSWLAVGALHARAPVDIPRLAEVSVDARTLVVALAVAVLASLVFGLLPTLATLIGRPLAPTLRAGDRSSTGGRGTRRLRGAMVVVEIALSIVLIIQAGLLARSLGALNRVDPGFGIEGLWRAQLPLTSASEGDEGVRRVEEIRDALAARPGVRGVTYGATLPLEWTGGTRCCQAVRVGGSVGEEQATLTRLHPVGHGYFDVLGIPLLEGASWGPGDVASGPTPVVINEELARSVFGNAQGVVGRPVAIGSSPALVVGLAGDVRHYGLEVEHGPALYAPPSFIDGVSLAVRVDPGIDAARTIRDAVWSVEPNLPVPTVESMAALERRSTRAPRFDSVLIGAISGVALLLAAGGLAGTLFFLVGERRREIGIRMTLGAASSTVVRDVVRRGLSWAGTGVVLGVGAGLAAARLLESRLFGVSTTDTLTVVVASTLLLTVALAASWLPARSAARVDAMETLRSE